MAIVFCRVRSLRSTCEIAKRLFAAQRCWRASILALHQQCHASTHAGQTVLRKALPHSSARRCSRQSCHAGRRNSFERRTASLHARILSTWLAVTCISHASKTKAAACCSALRRNGPSALSLACRSLVASRCHDNKLSRKASGSSLAAKAWTLQRKRADDLWRAFAP